MNKLKNKQKQNDKILNNNYLYTSRGEIIFRVTQRSVLNPILLSVFLSDSLLLYGTVRCCVVCRAVDSTNYNTR